MGELIHEQVASVLGIDRDAPEHEIAGRVAVIMGLGPPERPESVRVLAGFADGLGKLYQRAPDAYDGAEVANLIFSSAMSEQLGPVDLDAVATDFGLTPGQLEVSLWDGAQELAQVAARIEPHFRVT